MNGWYRNYGKRICDLLLSGVAILLSSPFMLLLALLVKFSSPGPVFFKQKRVGKNQTHFQILKFRTMRIDAPKDMPTHLLENPEAYITPIGKFLRKTSMDELPQIYHIFSGKMSLIGPRPALWNQYDLIDQREKYGANGLRPGLTGLAQISGRDELPIAEKAALDGEYAKNLSFGLDVKLFFQTFASVFQGKGIKEGATPKGEDEK